MLQATMAEMLAALEDQRAKDKADVEAQLRDAASSIDGDAARKKALEIQAEVQRLKADRKAEQERRERERKVRKQRFLLRAERDRHIQVILANTSVRARKDGTVYMIAKPGKKSTVVAAQSRVRQLNAVVQPRHQPRNPKWLADDYPEGAFRKRPDMPQLEALEQEESRLSKCCETIYNREGVTDRVARMMRHILEIRETSRVLVKIIQYKREQREQEREREFSANPHVRKTGRKNYQRFDG